MITNISESDHRTQSVPVDAIWGQKTSVFEIFYLDEEGNLRRYEGEASGLTAFIVEKIALGEQIVDASFYTSNHWIEFSLPALESAIALAKAPIDWEVV